MILQTDRLTEDFVERSREILQDNLVGVYLHGSLVMGCFNPQKSDIDLIVVVDEPLSDPVKRAYMDMVVVLNSCGPAKGIEMSIVLRRVCRPFVYPTPHELHFSSGHLEWYKKDPDDYIRRMKGTVEHSRHLEKCGIPASTLQLAYVDVSPYTEAAGSTGVADSDSSCPIVMVCCITVYAVSLMYSLSPS